MRGTCSAATTAGALLAYLRVVDPGVKYDEPSIGRVVTAPEVRGTGLGRALMREGLAGCARHWPGRAVRISAQARLQRFYAELGFRRRSATNISKTAFRTSRCCGGHMTASTHEVFNQSTPWSAPTCSTATGRCRTRWPSTCRRSIRRALAALGAEAGSAEMQVHARLANVHTPELHSHDRFGHRIDQVEFHPSYHALIGAALRHGLHGTPWRRGAGRARRARGGFMLFTELEPSVLCPVSMTYAVTPALRANPALHADWGAQPGQHRSTTRASCRSAHKTGADDGHGHDREAGRLRRARQHHARRVRRPTTPGAARYRLTGHKWFMSAPMCDAFLVLAQTAGGPVAASSCRAVLPDGSVNALRIQRLKDKLGNQANASSEVEFDGAQRPGWSAKKAAACRRSWRWARSRGSTARWAPAA